MKKTIAILLIPFFLIGCATVSKTAKLSIGMTKPEVIAALGKPLRAGATTDKSTGEPIEALVYKEMVCDTPMGNWVDQTYTSYIKVYFKNGKVTRYGADNDWETYADYEGERKIKITTDQNIKTETK